MSATTGVSRSQQLCATCQDLYAQGRGTTQCVVQHHQDFTSLKASVERRCYICVRLWVKLFGSKVKVTDDMFVRDVPTIRIAATVRGTDLAFTSGRPSNMPAKPLGRFFAGAEKGIEELAHFARSGNYASRDMLKQAEEWLSACRAEHTNCARSDPRAPLPTRLVEVRMQDGRMTARVRTGSSLPPDTEYLTLSHCWGAVPFFKLSEQTLPQAHVSLNTADLTPVFNDALRVTVRLGYTCIWIDSLCILQDSTDDWLHESQMMHQVYANSVCNLAATGFHDGQDGLLGERYESEIICHYDAEEKGICVVSCPDEWANQVTLGPLHQRAWVYQEQIMTTRVLHFGRTELFWECRTRTASEVYPQGLPSSMGVRNNIKKKVMLPQELSAKVNEAQLYLQWQRLVTIYTKGDLTYTMDKLPALSGLAKKFMQLLKDDYLAGLWRRDLLRCLLWEPTGEGPIHKPSSSSSTYRAPTWSWASTDCMARYPQWDTAQQNTPDTWKPLARVAQVEASPRNEDTTGQVIGGYLVLAGPLQMVLIHKLPELRWGKYEFCLIYPSSRNENIVLSHDVDARGKVELAISRLDVDTRGTQTLFLMPLLKNSNKIGSYLVTRGLILCRLENKGSYTRVGSFALFGVDFIQGFVRGRPLLREEDYEEYDGRGVYTVRVV